MPGPHAPRSNALHRNPLTSTLLMSPWPWVGSTSPKRRIFMFARIVELFPRPEKKNEFLTAVRSDVLPILKRQPGFIEILPFVPEVESEKIVVVTRWAEKK